MKIRRGPPCHLGAANPEAVRGSGTGANASSPMVTTDRYGPWIRHCPAAAGRAPQRLYNPFRDPHDIMIFADDPSVGEPRQRWMRDSGASSPNASPTSLTPGSGVGSNG